MAQAGEKKDNMHPTLHETAVTKRLFWSGVICTTYFADTVGNEDIR